MAARVATTAVTLSYLEYSYPGAIAAILLFTAIFSMISIIDDRREGFMEKIAVKRGLLHPLDEVVSSRK